MATQASRCSTVHPNLWTAFSSCARHCEEQAASVGVEETRPGECRCRELRLRLKSVSSGLSKHRQKAFATRGVEPLPFGIEEQVIHVAGDRCAAQLFS